MNTKEEIKEETVEEIKEETKQQELFPGQFKKEDTAEENKINIQNLIGCDLKILFTRPNQIEITDTEKSTQNERVLKKVNVVDCIMGFKIGDQDLPVFILQKGLDTNVINITPL